MINRFKSLLVRLLVATQPLAEGARTEQDDFLTVLLGIYRVSFSALRDINYLATHTEAAASVLDLARKLTEYSLTVEYMLMKGRDKKAKEFQDYLWVQLTQDREFLKSIGGKDQEEALNLDVSSAILAESYEKVPSYLKDGRHSWAGLSADMMLKALHDKHCLNDFDFSRIGQAYIWGSRLNHPNPMVVRGMLDPKESEMMNGLYMQQCLFLGLTFHLRLTTRYIDQIREVVGRNEYESIAEEVAKMYKELNSL